MSKRIKPMVLQHFLVLIYDTARGPRGRFRVADTEREAKRIAEAEMRKRNVSQVIVQPEGQTFWGKPQRPRRRKRP